MSLFRLDSSIRVDGSHSRAIADIVEQEWRAAHPGDSIVRRHVGVEPIPASAWATAVFASGTPAEERTPEQNSAVALAATLTDELIDADALVIAAPLYNFGVSQHFKAWVDLVIADPRMAAGTPREGWDHATGWMRRILADVWQLELRVVESEFTLVGINPALDQFKDLAHRLREEADRNARRLGRELAATATPSRAA